MPENKYEVPEISDIKEETSEMKISTSEIIDDFITWVDLQSMPQSTELDNDSHFYLCIQCDSEFIDKAKLKLHVQTFHRPVES